MNQKAFLRMITLLLTLTLLLSACAPKLDQEETADMLKKFTEVTGYSFTGTLRTDYGDRVIDFDVSYEHDNQTGGTLEVIGPELIKGIKATIPLGDTIKIEYDGLILEAGELPGTGLSPLETVPFFISQWQEGYITSTSVEKLEGEKTVRVDFSKQTTDTQGNPLKSITVSSWFLDGKPKLAELDVEGRQIVRFTIDSFVWG